MAETQPPALIIAVNLEVIDDPTSMYNGLWRLKMWTKAASDVITPNVFVWQEIPHVPYLDEAGYELNERGRYEQFVNMASQGDIFLYPELTPDSYGPFFRKNYLDICSKDKAILEETWRIGLAQLQQLTEELYRLLELPPAEVIEEVLP